MQFKEKEKAMSDKKLKKKLIKRKRWIKKFSITFVFLYFLSYQRRASSHGFAKLWWLAEIGLGLLVEVGLVSFLFCITVIGITSLIQIDSFCLIEAKFRFRRMVVMVVISWIRFGCIEIRLVREMKWSIWISFQCLFVIGVRWVFLGACFGKGFQFSLDFHIIVCWVLCLVAKKVQEYKRK